MVRNHGQIQPARQGPREWAIAGVALSWGSLIGKMPVTRADLDHAAALAAIARRRRRSRTHAARVRKSRADPPASFTL